MADKFNIPIKKFFVLTGAPGVGKTTLVKKLSSSLAKDGCNISGFYTEEVVGNGVRIGFDVITLDGARGRLARDVKLMEGATKHKVGKYGVLVQEFEDIALQSLEKTNIPSQLLVIDEIGKMEFFSPRFKGKVKEILSSPDHQVVLATIPLTLRDPLIQQIRKEHKLWVVTRENRNSIEGEILAQMKITLNNMEDIQIIKSQ